MMVVVVVVVVVIARPVLAPLHRIISVAHSVFRS